MLWYWLARLADTYLLCEMEGRRFVRWHLMRDGRIRVDYWDESDEERARRGARDPRVEPEPWLRRLPWCERAGAGLLPDTSPASGRGPGGDGVSPVRQRHAGGMAADLARPP